MNKAKTKKNIFLILFFLGILPIYSQTNISSLTQLKVWLRADTLVTLNVDSTISIWKDIKSGYDFAPSSGSQAPLIKADLPSLNLHSYANFSGNKGLLSLNNVALENNMTTILLIGELNTPSFFGHWVCYGTNSSGNWNFREVNTSGRLSLTNASDNNGAGVSNGNPAGNTTVLNVNPAIIMATIDPSLGQWNIFENFSSKDSYNGAFKQASSSPISIGYRTDAGLYANFKMAELMIFDSTLSLIQLATIKKYLQKRYSKEVSLGSDIIVPYGFCDTVLKVMDPAFSSFLWSKGDTTRTISIKKSGSYWVDVVDIYGLHSKDTVNVTFPQIPSIANTTICPGDSIVWNTHLSKKGYTFKWQDNSTDSLFAITQAGKYFVKVTDTLGCTLMSDTATITVDNISSSISLGNDTTFCSGNSIYLKKGASQAVSYLWSTNSTTDSLVIKTSGKYWLTVKSINNCSATDTINVIISGSAPTANFSNTPGVCIGKSMQFNDLSTAAAGNTIVSWSWDFGDSQIATQQNPIHIYSDTGSYKVKLNIITDGGCSNQFSKIVKVYPYPKIAIFASNACEQSTVQFSNTLLTFGYPITKWGWTFGDPSSGGNNFSALQNPTHLYGAQGNYQSQLIIQNSFGCADTAITTVTIKPKPTADFNYSFACKNDSIQFTNSSLLPTATSLQKTYWNFGDNSTSLLGNPKHKYISAVTYHASFIVTASNGCSDTARKTITVNDNPIAYFSTSNACVNSPVNFNDFSVISNGTIANWLWEIDSMMLSNLKNPLYTFTKVGNANVQLEVTSDKGCKNKTNKTIVINPTPTASFSLTPSYGNPPFAVNFTNTSNGALSYVWNFGDGNTSILQNPTNTYKDTGSFKVTLTIKNNLGCVNAVSKTVNSLKKLVDVKVQDISAVFKNDFLNITVQLVNKGTVDITKLDLYIKVNDGPEVKEEWSGLLLRGGALIHTFKASVSLKDDNHYVCVTAANPNGLDDEDPSNNKLCKGINVNTFQVFELYPNPVKEAISVTLPLVIPKKELLTITIYDCNGKFVKTAFSEVLTEGLQLVNISVIGLKSGLYACKIEYRKESAIKKMILY